MKNRRRSIHHRRRITTAAAAAAEAFYVVVVLVLSLLLSNLHVTSSQQIGDGSDNVCRAPKPAVSLRPVAEGEADRDGDESTTSSTSTTTTTRREYIVGANSWHVPVIEYLTDVMGNDFEPPISFTRITANMYMKGITPKESLSMGYDFMIANPYVSSCFESEGKTITLATQVTISSRSQEDDSKNTMQYYNLTQYGATLYTLKNRTDIQTLQDIKGKIIGTNKITNLATHLCYDVLLRNGVHHLQDVKQTIFFKDSDEALGALLAGKVDVGCAATSILENHMVNVITSSGEQTQELLDISQTIRILNPQQHTTDGIEFPFAISSDLVPGYLVQAYPHVEQSVKLRFQNELLAMRDHADVAPALLACLDASGCTTNNTQCMNECFEELPYGTIRNCDTTPQLVIKAYNALTASELVGFTEPLQNLRLRDIQEKTGFLIKDNDSAATPRCVRMNNIVDATTCPVGHFARSSQEIVQQCNVSGLPCYDTDCICSPCVKAYEVDFFPMTDDDLEAFNDNTTNTSFVGNGCSKFSLCGTVQQEHVLSFHAIDNKARWNATMTGAFLLEDESEEPFTFEHVNGTTYHFDFFATKMTAGQKTVKIRINDEEIPESPFRLIVLKRDCVTDTGDEQREPNDWGECVCKRGTVELFDKCISLAILIPSIMGPSLLLLLVAVHFYVAYKRDQSDNIWKLDPTELLFDDPPRVLGRGTFGLVLLAEYRGTSVAVKRVLPPNKFNKIHFSGMPSHIEFNKMECLAQNNYNHSGSQQHMQSSGWSSVSSNNWCWRTRAAQVHQGLAKDMRMISERAFWKRKAVRHFVEEIRLLSKLRHPSITTVMGAVISSTSEPMLVMEFMHFGSLHDLLHNESMVLEGEVQIGILQDVASGLRFLHSSDPAVLHGDLKSQNILVDDKFRAKVADFGCGDFGMSHTGSVRKTKARGTPYWMAPELLRGEMRNTKESDVYAFGIVMYEVFSRKDPYDGETFEDVMRVLSRKDANKRPPVPDDCPAEVAKMMKACLKSDPKDRPTATGLDICLRWMGGTTAKTSDSSSRQNKQTGDSPTDVLLEQMFPRHIAEALKEGRKVEPETHEEVTIVFSEIVGYTDIASVMSATKVSDLLDRLYNSFDDLCERLDVFKVETIGDSFMVACNLVKSQPNHVSLAARFAVEAMLVASTVPIDMDDPSTGFVQLRIGFHTGSVVTHVIGTKNARFTLIGETVTMAALMESNSLPGKILCSAESYRLWLASKEDDKGEFLVEERGAIEVKGKGGGTMMTYWIGCGPDRLESC